MLLWRCHLVGRSILITWRGAAWRQGGNDEKSRTTILSWKALRLCLIGIGSKLSITYENGKIRYVSVHRLIFIPNPVSMKYDTNKHNFLLQPEKAVSYTEQSEIPFPFITARLTYRARYCHETTPIDCGKKHKPHQCRATWGILDSSSFPPSLPTPGADP